jgi:putative acetyltransferase
MFINMDANSVKIRNYEDSDKQRLLEIYDAAIPLAHWFLDEVTLLKQRQIGEECFDSGDSQTFVLEIDGNVVGFSTLFSRPKSEIIISGFVIDPQFQGNGRGKMLMKDIQKKMSKHTIKLAVYEKNQKALNFYMKNGFEETSSASENPESPKYLVMEWKVKNN